MNDENDYDDEYTHSLHMVLCCCEVNVTDREIIPFRFFVGHLPILVVSLSIKSNF